MYTKTVSSTISPTSPVSFLPHFIPVLEHRPNTKNLRTLEQLLKSGTLGDKYGGMIFTSQRAVEAWADVVKGVEQDIANRVKQNAIPGPVTGMVCPPPNIILTVLARGRD